MNPEAQRAPWVVKLGGSLIGDPTLKRWLELLARAGAGRVVIVPGGGAFADQVRAAQALCRFDDATAHEMAILAMEQFGLMLCALDKRLVRARCDQRIDDALIHARTPVWLPCAMLRGEDEIPENWEVTSDSLAAWLALRLGASHLVLVKSLNADQLSAPLSLLAQSGAVDRALPTFAARASLRTWVLAKTQLSELERELSRSTPQKVIYSI